MNDLILQTESDSLEISKWFAAHDLTLNLNRTKYIYFTLRQSDYFPNLKFHSPTRKNVDENCQHPIFICKKCKIFRPVYWLAHEIENSC